MLIVFAGRAGTGKTTLSRRVAADRGAALLRVDAIETAVVEVGLADLSEHERRGRARTPDLVGQRVPTWDEVRQDAYVRWDE